jgi:LysR family transcriptional regulator, low CO2-responsive transcriptional regulator
VNTMKNTDYKEPAPDLLDTRQLLAFKTIVETGGFTRAARQLHLTQSALSHQIKTLETQLQTQVFKRVGKRVVLTQAGEILLRYTIPVLRQLLEARQVLAELHEPGHGRLRISAASYCCYHLLPHVLREFRVSYPHVEILVAAEYTAKAVQSLLGGDLDLAIFVLPPSTKGLHVEELCQDELVVAVSPSHPWARRRRIQWEDLASQVLITYNRASETFQEIQSELQERGIMVKETMEVHHGAAVMEMVKMDLGVALLPLWVARDDIEQGLLKGLSLGRAGLKRRWGIAHVRDAPLPAYSEKFIQLCHAWAPRLMTDAETE